LTTPRRTRDLTSDHSGLSPDDHLSIFFGVVINTTFTC
jgi:hypothetical protein